MTADMRLFIQEIHKNLGGLFAPQRSISIARVPGRIDIIGGHCVTCGGTIVQTQVAEGIIVAVQRRMDQRILIRNLNMIRERVITLEFRLEDIQRAAQERDWAKFQNVFTAADKGWSGHICGALGLLMTGHSPVHGWTGFNIAISTSLPAGAGLASSAALQTGLLLALRDVVKLPLETAQIATLAAASETEVMHRPAHAAEYISILHGQKENLIVVQAPGEDSFQFIPLPDGIRCVAVDLGIRKQADRQKQEEFQTALHIGHALQGEMLRSDGGANGPAMAWTGISVRDWQSRYKKRMPYRMTGQEFLQKNISTEQAGIDIDPQKKYMPRSATEFMIEDNERAREFVALCKEAAGDAGSPLWIDAGQLLFVSHERFIKTSATVCEESAWLMDELRAGGPERGIFGARAMAGGGCTVGILATAHSNDVLQNLLSRYQDRFDRPASLLTGSSAGALVGGIVTTAFA